MKTAFLILLLGLAMASLLRADLTATYSTGSEIPLSSNGFTATGSTLNLTLNYAPAAGTALVVVENTALSFINGTFDNLVQGQTVALSYAGITYNFVANYFGGTGNDLVLVWANNRTFAWGWNGSGQLGDNTTTQRNLPVSVMTSGVLLGKTVVTVSAGEAHSLALCSDGTVAAWGNNAYGQLGDNSTTQRTQPVSVNTENGVSALHGKTVVAIAAGGAHSLALCSDGTVAAWGYDGAGQLGDATATTLRQVPVAVYTGSGGSALFGKTVVAIAAGYIHSLALCSDGTVAAWGQNLYGQLGDNSTTQRTAPVAVNTASGVSALYGKTVAAISAGFEYTLAQCTDGTVAAWGRNDYGQLGDNSTTQRNVPVVVSAANGVSALYGKTVVAVAGGYSHSLALCSDSTLAAWGRNDFGQLGDNSIAQRNAPVAVNTVNGISTLFGKTVAVAAGGSNHSFAICSDGTVAAWGLNFYGALGDNTASDRHVPIAVNRDSLAPGEQFTRVASGAAALHTLGLVATPIPPAITAQPQSITVAAGALGVLQVIPSGIGPFSYQWEKDGVTIPGATNDTYSIASAQPWHIGNYTVTVTDAAGQMVVSDSAGVSLTGVNTGLWRGLVAYYRMNGNGNDSSLNGLNGTVMGATAVVDRFGDVSSAYDFAGESQRIEVPSNPALAPSEGSVSIWVRGDSWTTSDAFVDLFSKDGDSERQWTVQVAPSGTLRVALFTTSGEMLADSFSSIPTGQWKHVVMTWNASSLRGYVDGVEFCSTPVSGTIVVGSNPVRIACVPTSGTAMNGGADDARIYNRALSGSEVAALYESEDPDSDHDGIPNRFETATGIYVSATDTGTNPTNPDTDGDGLSDGAEVNIYHSNPNMADTDGDGFNDGFEVSTGFSPTSAASTPDTLSSIFTAVEYRFNAANGVSYRIEVSTDLATWSTLETPILGNGGVITRFYSVEGQPRRFFRSRRN